MLASVGDISPLMEARLIGHLKLGGWPFGLLLNFNVTGMGKGVRRLVTPGR